MFRCNTCGIDKPHTEFYYSRTQNDYRIKACTSCYNKKANANRRKRPLPEKRRRRDPEEVKHRNLLLTLKKFNLSLERYEEFLENQKGCCAICHNPPPGKKRLCVDHDHTTGYVRGLLCDACNVMLGLAKDNATTLKSASEYLITHAPADISPAIYPQRPPRYIPQ